MFFLLFLATSLKKRSFDLKLASELIPLKLERGTLIVALPG